MAGTSPPGADKPVNQHKPVNQQRRLKREIWSKQHTFLAVCQSSLRDLCLEECRRAGLDDACICEAGVSFRGKLSAAYRACLCLGTASRVRLTIAEFRAGAREELYRKAGRIPWELWVSGRAVVRAKARASRFGHEGAVAGTVAEAVSTRLAERGITGEQRRGSADRERPEELLVRMDHNTCTIHLDLSGAPLYRRGYRQVTVAAPLREDLAYAVAMRALAMGPGAPRTVVDTMTGSGTLAIEAACVLSGRGAGYARKNGFAFESAPWFRSETFEYERRRAAGEAAGIPSILAVDSDPEAVEAATQNVKNAGLQGLIEIRQGDALSVVGTLPDHATVALANPPYGVRIPGRAGARHYLGQIAGSLPNGSLYYLWPDRNTKVTAEETGQQEGTDKQTEKRGPSQPLLLFRHGGLRVGLFKA